MSRLPPLGALVLRLSLLLHPALSDYTSSNNTSPHDNNDECTCYVIQSGANSDTPAYFQYYRFYDFRNLSSSAGQFTEAPPLVNDTQDAGQEPVWEPNILNSDAWNQDWNIQNWSKKATEDFPTPMVNSPANIYLGQNDDSNDPFTWLTLRTSRLEDFQSSGEIENMQKNLMHVSMRMYGRVTGAKGAVAGFFTYFDDTNESDIEILTNDPKDVIRYTNQPALDKEGNEVAQASVAANQLAPWDDWQMHRIDWLPKNSYWYLNTKQVAANTYSVPRKPSWLTINMWSDGGEWSGNMTEGDSAEFQIQWIEMTFNTSGPVAGSDNNKRGLDLEKRKSNGCKVVCRIDDVAQMGTPEVISRSAASDVNVSWSLLVVVGVVSILVGI